MAPRGLEPQTKLRIIWLAFLATAVLYVMVTWFAVGDGLDAAAPNSDPLRTTLQAGAIGAAIASFLAKRQWTKLVLAAAQPGGSGDPFTPLRTGCFVTWGLSEVVAIFGVFTAFVTRHAGEVVPYAGATLFLLYMHRLDMWPLPTASPEPPSDAA